MPHQDSEGYPEEEILYETMLAKFGSRIVLIPQANQQQMQHGLLGFYYDEPVQVTLATFSRGTVRALPFSSVYPAAPGHRDNQAFESITQRLGLTFVSYHCRSPAIPYTVTFTLSAPFYPGDIKLSTAPFFYIDVEVSNVGKGTAEGSILVALEGIFAGNDRKGRGELYRRDRLVGCRFKSAAAADETEVLATDRDGISYAIGDHQKKLYADFAAAGELRNTIFPLSTKCFSCGALSWKFKLPANGVKKKVFILAGYFPAAALNIKGTGSSFLYTKYFKNVDEVLSYARSERNQIQKRSEFFEHTLAASSVPGYLKQLIAFSFQSYVANTWWVRRGRRDWYSVWEGSCRFHSTIDVAYNAEIFSLLLWPELLKRQLDEWSEFPINDYLAHDTGDDLKIFGQAYEHDMPVEECTNFLLLLYAYWNFTGDHAPVQQHHALVKRLLRYLMNVDADDDGLPDIPAAVLNTFDDASVAVQGSKNQIYLGVKCLAAFVAGQHLAEHVNDKKLHADCGRWIERIATTLIKRCWRDDHFAICLDRSIQARDGCSMHAANGLLYLLLTDTEIPLPLELFAQDIQVHQQRLMKRYGCTHSEADYTTWVSQNMWRDLIGLYLGIDTLGNARRYRDFELSRNAWDTGAFTDVYRYGRHLVDLDRYPRGIAALGYLYAVAGVAINKVSGKLKICPQRTMLNIPLVSEADWKRMRLPWVRLTPEDAWTEFEISDFACLSGFREIELQIPTVMNPGSIRITPANSEKLNVRINPAYRDEDHGVWITELRLTAKPGHRLRTFRVRLS